MLKNAVVIEELPKENICAYHAARKNMTKGSLIVFFATSNRRSSSVKNETHKYVVFLIVGS